MGLTGSVGHGMRAGLRGDAPIHLIRGRHRRRQTDVVVGTGIADVGHSDEAMIAPVRGTNRRRDEGSKPRASTRAPSLAVIMPVFNEEATIRQAVMDVLTTTFPCPVQLIVVDDGSTDGTARALTELDDSRLVVIHHEGNRGKGAALRTGAAAASATHVVPFDADLEYRAADLVTLLEPVVEGRAQAVYGTRVTAGCIHHSSRIYALANTAMTTFANRLYRSSLTDMHTCLKLVPRDLFRQIPFLEEGFGLDTELTAWLLRCGLTFAEVPVSYHSRSRAEGKKIGWRDGLACFHILVLIRLERAPLIALDGTAAADGGSPEATFATPMAPAPSLVAASAG